MLSRFEHSPNAFHFITIISSGNVTFFRLSHFQNAFSSICVKFEEIETLCKFVQPEKAFLSILVTVSGITISFKPVHPANKHCDISVTPSSNITFDKLSQFSNGPSEYPDKLSQLVCALSRLFGILIIDNSIQSANAVFPISFKFLDNITFPKDESPENAPPPIFSTLSGIITVFKSVRF